MKPADFPIVLNFFPSSKWVAVGSKKHDDAVALLADADTETARFALESLKRIKSRNFITPDELAKEIDIQGGRIKKQNAQKVESLNREEVEAEYEKALLMLASTPRVKLADAIASGRISGFVTREPIDPDPSKWSRWTVGVVAVLVKNASE